MIIALTFLGARYLSADHFGVFALMMSSVSSVATLSGVGVGVINNSTASRYYDDDPDFVSAVFTGTLLVCLILSLVFALAFLPLIDLLDSGLSVPAALCILFVVSALMTVASASEGLAYGIRRTGTMLIISLIVLAIAPAASILLMISWGLNGAIGALILFRSLQSGMLFIVLTISTRIRITPIRAWQDRVRLTHLFLATSLPLAGAAVFAAPVTTFAMFLLQQHAGVEQVGAFALAYQIFLMLVFPPGAMGQFLISQLAEKGANPQAILGRAIVYFIGYGLLGWGMMAGSSLVIPLITLTHVDLTLMATFGAAVLLYTISISFNCYWISTGNARMVLVGQVGWAVPIVLITFFGATNYGALALAVGFVVGTALQLSIHGIRFFLKKEP